MKTSTLSRRRFLVGVGAGAAGAKLNAVVQLCAERGLSEARVADAALAKGNLLGPLHGVPCTMKDSWETAGVISTGGTLGRKGFIPSRDSTVVARVRSEGAILMGKTNTPEFTLSYQKSNLIYGRTYNSYKAGHQPGGSIRGPAHFNGIAGIKPTSGRVPRTGHIVDFGGFWDYCQFAGPLAHWVEDFELITPIISGPDFIDTAIVPMPWAALSAVDVKKLRVAYYLNNGSETAPTAETLAAVTKVRATSARSSITITPAGRVRSCASPRRPRVCPSASNSWPVHSAKTSPSPPPISSKPAPAVTKSPFFKLLLSP